LDDPRKNVALLIEAAGLLRQRVPRLELWISGPGNLDRLLREASPSGRASVVNIGLGSQEEHAQRYARAWATVLPSYDEAFGLCLIESLAAGTPIVVLTGSGGPAEIVRQGTGIESQPTAEGLADACARALELSQTEGIAEACRAEALRYDWRSAIVPQLEQVYTGST
jgi:alpha-1,3-rhamnosyl/mannosyltransferase